MSEVRLSIGGRDYTVACADGEEAHVTRLGEAIDGKFRQLGGSVSNKEAQNLLFAALLLADELHEQRDAMAIVHTARDTADSAQAELAERESELERLRSALHEAELGGSAAKSEIETLRADVETARANETVLRTELENLRGEHEALTGELDSARSAPVASGPFDDPDLAPALERFADLLENCADKLESKVTTS